MPNGTKKAPRITAKASCIREASATAKMPRAFQINSPSFQVDEITPDMSGKYTALVKKIKDLDALDKRDYGTRFKHFIFTDMRDSGSGAKALAAFLIAGGFELQMKHAPKFILRNGQRIETKDGETIFVKKDSVPHGNYGFAMLQSAPLWKNPLSVTTKKEILRVYNSRPENVNGQLLRIIVLDSKYKEGIDLFDVKYVHFIEPPLGSSDLKQALGRATRFCGQKGLQFIPNKGWPLQVYTYTTDIPGRFPFLEDDAVKVGGANTKPDVYSIFGHGADIPGEGRKRIPKGNTYVTLMSCGNLSYIYSDFGRLFSEPNTIFKGQTIRTILSNPTEHEELLVDLFKSYNLPEPHIHTHSEGPAKDDNTYVDAVFSAGLTWNSKDIPARMFRSGLYTLGNFTLKSMNKYKTKNGTEFYVKLNMKITDVPALFRGSIQPKQSDIEAYIRDNKLDTFEKFHKALSAQENPFRIKQSQLFKKFPGVHYNPVCRFVKGVNEKYVGRIMSAKKSQRMDAHELVLKHSGIDFGFFKLILAVTKLAEESAVDMKLNRTINTTIHAQSGGVRLSKCFKRKSKHFPFCKTFMVRMAKRLKLDTPTRAKREYYCRLMDTNPEYRAMLFKATTPNTVASPVFLLRPKTIPTLSSLANDSFKEFQTGIYNLYKQYEWKERILENGCMEPPPASRFGTPLTFNPTQEFIRHYLTPASPFKGLLAWHSVGTGKTCTAIATASSSFEQEGYQILWVTRNALMSDVWKNMFGSVCSIPILDYLKQGKLIPDELASQKKLLSHAWLQPMSYKMFQNALEQKNEIGRSLYARNARDPLFKTFLIIDEIHKLYDGDLLPGELADFKVLQHFIHQSYKTSGVDSARVLLMSATPITEHPDQLFSILNTLRTDNYFPPFAEFRERFCKEDTISDEGRSFFQEGAKGIISYLNREHDPTTFAQPEFHTVRVAIGETVVPSIERLVDECMPIVLDCENSEEFEAKIAALKKDAMPARNYKKEVSAIRKRQKTQKAECKKSAYNELKQCYMEHKKRYTLKNKRSQMTALESCFGKPQAHPFIALDDLKEEFNRRFDHGNDHRSINSRGAVRTPVE